MNRSEIFLTPVVNVIKLLGELYRTKTTTITNKDYIKSKQIPLLCLFVQIQVKKYFSDFLKFRNSR